ncbi:MAG: hypothetical protein E6I68_12320 [Chloroflexi bacterium]|nr:MAG: hypothetical protein E6I68_12320 [Chloroflexota bacterium]
MGAAHLARGRPRQDDRLLPRPPDHALGWKRESMIRGTFSARAYSWLAVLAGAAMLPSCTSASGAASPSRSVTPAPTPCTPGGTPPPARMGAAMTYDAATRTVVLFGGISGDGTPLSDTWAWDGCHWSQLKPAVSPPGRSFGALAFDASSGKVILFGGGAANADPTRIDTWSWNGATWTEEHPATGPARLSNPLLTDDPTNRNLLLFGIGGPRFQTPLTWTWDGKNWTDRHPSKSPPYRNSAALAPGARSGVLLYGGAPAIHRQTPRAAPRSWRTKMRATTSCWSRPLPSNPAPGKLSRGAAPGRGPVPTGPDSIHRRTRPLSGSAPLPTTRPATVWSCSAARMSIPTRQPTTPGSGMEPTGRLRQDPDTDGDVDL